MAIFTRRLFMAGALALLPAAAPAQERQAIQAAGLRLSVDTIATGLSSPWGGAFLPGGRMLVTEKGGALRLIAQDGTVSEPLGGVPRVQASGQGGLLDVALDPDFVRNRLVYLSYAEPREGGAGTSAGRGRLNAEATALEDFQVIFRQEPAVSGGNHFGSRLAFSRDGKLFITMADRFNHMEEAQNLANHLGKLVRVDPDGSVPRDNPFVDRADAKPEIWSYGHRNVQGAAINPASGALWIAEMGPAGGDELNLPRPGANFGWPLVSHGRHYGGTPIPDPSTRPDFTSAIHQWTPVIAPSGITFITTSIPAWRGNLVLAGLRAEGLVRLTLNGERVTGEERIPLGARIRDVIEGPDGLYALTDGRNGRLLRIRAE